MPWDWSWVVDKAEGALSTERGELGHKELLDVWGLLVSMRAAMILECK